MSTDARPRDLWQSTVGLALSLRFLRTAARQLVTAPHRLEPRRVSIRVPTRSR